MLRYIRLPPQRGPMYTSRSTAGTKSLRVLYQMQGITKHHQPGKRVHNCSGLSFNFLSFLAFFPEGRATPFT